MPYISILSSNKLLLFAGVSMCSQISGMSTYMVQIVLAQSTFSVLSRLLVVTQACIVVQSTCIPLVLMCMFQKCI